MCPPDEHEDDLPSPDDPLLSAVCRRYEAAWSLALQGAAPPVADDYLAELSSQHATAARELFDRIDRSYQSRVSQAGAQVPGPTIDPGQTETVKAADDASVQTSAGQPRASAPAGEATVMRPATPVDEGGVAPDIDVTMERVPDDSSGDSPEPGLGATMSVAPGGERRPADFEFSWYAEDTEDEPRSASGGFPHVAGYQILGELGRGGMGVVYRARQRALKRVVALKMILAGAHAGPEQLQRFRSEAEAVALLQHVNIVQIYEVGEQDGLPFCALEFVDGMSLEYDISGQPQDPREAAQLLEQVARAMHHAHEHGIVHRDLKPANILLTRERVPKITDFGLVKRIEGDSAGQTQSGTILGTPSFMSPEQGRGQKDVGPASDIYALGATLYAQLTGRPPFLGPTPMKTLMLLLRDEPVPPTRLQPHIPRDLETICLKCLQKEPHKRYETAGALADDLSRYLKGEPISARPVGRWERGWRWCRRNPRVALLSGLALLLALALMIGGPLAAAIVYQQKEIAVKEKKRADTKAREASDARATAEENEQAARAAEKVADENADVAKQQRKLALDTLYGVVTQVEEKLRDRTELSELRKNVLELAMKGLKDVSAKAGKSALAERSIGAAHQRLGDIVLRAGLLDQAREQYEAGLAIFEVLLSEDPANDLARWNAALTCDGLGDVSRKKLEDAAIARSRYEEALEYRQVLRNSAQAPELKEFMILASLVNSHGRLGDLWLHQLADPASAAGHYQAAMEQAEQLAKLLPDHPVVKQALSGSWHVYGMALARLDEYDKATSLIERALNVRQALLASSPQSVKAQQDVAVSNWALGDLALAAGDGTAAARHYTAAHELREALFASDSQSAEMQEDLANSFYRLGCAHLATGNVEQAASDFRECCRLREQVVERDPENASRQIQLALALARCGQRQRAIELAAKLHETLYPNPGTLFSLACCYALCAGDASEANGTPPSGVQSAANSPDANSDSAFQLLQQAADRHYRDAWQLKHHPDLILIRQDPRFQKLLQFLAD